MLTIIWSKTISYININRDFFQNIQLSIKALQFDLKLTWKKNIAVFSKDFDKVLHKGLIHKINSYGIQGNLIKWFENYLYKRKQKIINKNSCSCLEPVSAEVSLGSVLEPLMFLIYINDIGEKVISLSRLFADDTSLGYSSQSVDQIKTVINHDILELNAWSSKWLISFNPEKNRNHLFFLILVT